MKFIGIILVLLGALWMLQGLGYVGGSFMTGDDRWLLIGVVTAAAGAAAFVWSIRADRRVP